MLPKPSTLNVGVEQAYKTLSDPEKRAKWQSGENPEATGIPSDTQTLTVPPPPSSRTPLEDHVSLEVSCAARLFLCPGVFLSHPLLIFFCPPIVTLIACACKVCDLSTAQQKKSGDV